MFFNKSFKISITLNYSDTFLNKVYKNKKSKLTYLLTKPNICSKLRQRLKLDDEI